jgi:hypothetical protein
MFPSYQLFDLPITSVSRQVTSHQSPSRALFFAVFGPNGSTSFLKRGSHNDEAGENCGKADQCVNDGVDLQYHIRAPSVPC